MSDNKSFSRYYFPVQKEAKIRLLKSKLEEKRAQQLKEAELGSAQKGQEARAAPAGIEHASSTTASTAANNIGPSSTAAGVVQRRTTTAAGSIRKKPIIGRRTTFADDMDDEDMGDEVKI